MKLGRLALLVMLILAPVAAHAYNRRENAFA